MWEKPAGSSTNSIAVCALEPVGWYFMIMRGFICWLWSLSLLGAITPFRPADDTLVLLKLPRGESSAIEREIRSLRATLRNQPDDLVDALRLAQKLLVRARAESDPRYLGQAESVLGPWWSKTEAPTDVLLLRATIEQSRHAFTEALATLDRILVRDSRAGGAWLTKATIHTLRGDYAEARRACLPLARLTDSLTAFTAAAALGGLTGEAESSLQHLEVALARTKSLDSATLVWSHNVGADLAERLDQLDVAERHYQAALALVPDDPFTLSVWADFSMLHGHAAEVVTRLTPHAEKDALLLRLAEAKKWVAKGKTEALQAEIVRLENGFLIARRRGVSHAREEARFYLHLLNQPTRALVLAQENWQQQREPADLRLLLECGQAANNPLAVESALAWLRTNRLEDAVFHRLASAL